jgi:hypothetical protein
MSGAEVGRIPLRVRVGVTGHRTIADPPSVSRRVREVLDLLECQVFSRSVATRVVYTVVTSLAEGADRLVPRLVLEEREGTRLEVVLPLERDDYMEDFKTVESRAEFLALLSKAVQPPREPERPESRPQAYAVAGRALVDRVDVLIAVWDHEPPRGVGGTAEVIEYARLQGLPTFIISAIDPDRLDCPTLPAQLPGSRVSRFLHGFDSRLGGQRAPSRLETLRVSSERLDKFNRERLAPARLAEAREAERRTAAMAAQAGVDEGFAEWVLPSFVRADTLAGRHQRIYTLMALAVFLFAASAVLVAAGQELYFRERPRLILIEVVLMIAFAFFVYAAHRNRYHDRWISYRTLAENLRSAPYMALIMPAAVERELIVDQLDPWFQRAFTEIWTLRPASDRIASCGDEGSALREFFDIAWISGQIKYHADRSVAFARYHHRLTLLINALFLGTFVAALLHAVWQVENRTIVFLAIALPAFGAGLSGYRELRQFRLHAERYRRAKDRLEHVRRRMLKESDPTEVRTFAAGAYTIMLEESLDWYGVLEFHNLEMVV